MKRPDWPLDVYLLPAVVGGGLGDIEEVLAAGRYLETIGARLLMYRERNRPLPPSVDGPWEWPRVRRTTQLVPRSRRALTIAPSWGVSAAPGRPEPFGRAGPWAAEATAIEGAYGTASTLHVSLEEFARTYTSRRENSERYREGGVSRFRTAKANRGASGLEQRARWRTAFRKFRAFDRPNVLHLFATLSPSPPFSREFPEAVQVGPLWSHPDASPVPGRRVSRTAQRVLWYASPASCSTIAPQVIEGLGRGDHPVDLRVRSARPWPLLSTTHVRAHQLAPLSPAPWRREWNDADLHIVTGSRTLIQALESAGPFLYFNGTTGSGTRRRRHRPEKISALLELFGRLGVSRRIVRDLDAFSRGRRTAEVVARAAGDVRWRQGFPTRAALRRATPRGAGEVLVDLAREFATGGELAPEVVRRYRNLPP